MKRAVGGLCAQVRIWASARVVIGAVLIAVPGSPAWRCRTDGTVSGATNTGGASRITLPAAERKALA